MTFPTGFDERTQANMEVALERACRSLSDRDNTHENRKRVAQSLIDCAHAGRDTLGDLTAAARRTVLEICSKPDHNNREAEERRRHDPIGPAATR